MSNSDWAIAGAAGAVHDVGVIGTNARNGQHVNDLLGIPGLYSDHSSGPASWSTKCSKE